MIGLRGRCLACGLSAAAILLATATPAAGQVPSPPEVPAAVRAVAGCYAITLGPWVTVPEGSQGSAEIPLEIRLDTFPELMAGRVVAEGRWALHPRRGVSPTESTFWAFRAQGDSVILGWSQFPGYGPVAFVAVQEGRLEGRLTQTTDEIFITEEYPRGIPEPWRPFNAVPIPCEREDGSEVAPRRTVEELWGTRPPQPSCYVDLRPVVIREEDGTAAWVEALAGIDTLRIGPPGTTGDSGWLSPALREVPGRWVVRSAGDPRLTLEWDDGFADAWWQASLWGDTLRASGRVAAAPPEPPTVPTGTSTPPSSTGRVSFEALRVDCPLGPGGAPLPVEPPPPHPGVLQRAGCYALTPSFDAGQPLEPLLQEVIAALGIVELHPEFEIDADGDPAPSAYRLSPLLAPSDSIRSDVGRWRIDRDGNRITLFWGTPNRVQLFGLFEGDDFTGTVDARVRAPLGSGAGGRPGLLGEGYTAALEGVFRAERVECG